MPKGFPKKDKKDFVVDSRSKILAVLIASKGKSLSTRQVAFTSGVNNWWMAKAILVELCYKDKLVKVITTEADRRGDAELWEIV